MNSFSGAAATLKMQRSLHSFKLPDVEMPEMPTMPSVTSVTQQWDSVRKRFLGDTEPARPAATPLQTQASSNDSGSMWDRVLGAIHLPSYDDGYESDRDGFQGESHLIRVMKEYHVAKASDVSQLPAWLISPSERSRSALQPASSYDEIPTRQQGSVFADVAERPKYSRRKTSDADSGYGSTTSSISSFSSYSTPPVSRTGSRTSDKLRALRRPAAASGADSEEDGQPGGRSQLQDRSQSERLPPAVRGLPARGAQRLRA